MHGPRRILIDGSMASRGGGFTYLVNLVPRLARAHPEDRFRLLLRNPRIAASLPTLPNLELAVLPDVGWLARLRFTSFAAPRLAREWGADLYFSAGEYAPPRAPCPVIASFRNPNVFTSLDQGWPWRQRLRLGTLRMLARLSAATCARILFVSEDSARWIGDGLGLPPARRAVVHHGIDAEAWRPAARSDHARPCILSVSTIYRYKNFVRLIEAYGLLALRRPDAPDLVILGDDQDAAFSRRMEAARAALGERAARVKLLGEVPYADVRQHYAAASLFVFPSYLETFGHPLLEAMASEIPVVAADIPVFREIAGDAVLYADPYSSEAMARAMEQALEQPELRDTLVRRGREHVREFGWDRTAARLSALFDEVLAEGIAR
jgi:glycosyltransferase involved in cell wall biosynthesis